MLKFRRQLSITVLTSFLLNTIAADFALSQPIAYHAETDKLAIASTSNGILGQIRQEKEDIGHALESLLIASSKPGTAVDLTTFKSISSNVISDQHTLFQSGNIQYLAREMKALDDGRHSVECRIRTGDSLNTYRVIFSTERDAHGGFPITVYTQREYQDFLYRTRVSSTRSSTSGEAEGMGRKIKYFVFDDEVSEDILGVSVEPPSGESLTVLLSSSEVRERADRALDELAGKGISEATVGQDKANASRLINLRLLSMQAMLGSVNSVDDAKAVIDYCRATRLEEYASRFSNLGIVPHACLFGVHYMLAKAFALKWFLSDADSDKDSAMGYYTGPALSELTQDSRFPAEFALQLEGLFKYDRALFFINAAKSQKYALVSFDLLMKANDDLQFTVRSGVLSGTAILRTKVLIFVCMINGVSEVFGADAVDAESAYADFLGAKRYLMEEILPEHTEYRELAVRENEPFLDPDMLLTQLRDVQNKLGIFGYYDLTAARRDRANLTEKENAAISFARDMYVIHDKIGDYTSMAYGSLSRRLKEELAKFGGVESDIGARKLLTALNDINDEMRKVGDADKQITLKILEEPVKELAEVDIDRLYKIATYHLGDIVAAIKKIDELAASISIDTLAAYLPEDKMEYYRKRWGCSFASPSLPDKPNLPRRIMTMINEFNSKFANTTPAAAKAAEVAPVRRASTSGDKKKMGAPEAAVTVDTVREELKKYGIVLAKEFFDFDFTKVPQDAEWAMFNIRDPEFKPIYEKAEDIPEVQLLYPLDKLPLLHSGNRKYTKGVFLGTARFENIARPVVIKLFAPDHYDAEWELQAAQMIDRLGIGPHFFGVVKDIEHRNVIGYVMQFVAGYGINAFDAILAVEELKDVSTINMRLKQAGLKPSGDFVRTMTDRLVGVDAGGISISDIGKNEDFIRKLNEGPNGKVSRASTSGEALEGMPKDLSWLRDFKDDSMFKVASVRLTDKNREGQLRNAFIKLLNYYGGKALGLFWLRAHIKGKKNWNVPDFKLVQTGVFDRFMARSGITEERIRQIYEEAKDKTAAYNKIKDMFHKGGFEEKDQVALREMFDSMARHNHLAVRSSSILEDIRYPLFGAYDSFFINLHILTDKEGRYLYGEKRDEAGFALFLEILKMMYASAYSPLARSEKEKHRIKIKDKIGGVLQALSGDDGGRFSTASIFSPAISGVAVSSHPDKPSVAVVEANYGSNLPTVKGRHELLASIRKTPYGTTGFSSVNEIRGGVSIFLDAESFPWTVLDNTGRIFVLPAQEKPLSDFCGIFDPKNDMFDRYSPEILSVTAKFEKEWGRPIQMEYSIRKEVEEEKEINPYQIRPVVTGNRNYKNIILKDDVPKEKVLADSTECSGNGEFSGPIVWVEDSVNENILYRIGLNPLFEKGFILAVSEEKLERCLGGSVSTILGSHVKIKGFLLTDGKPMPLTAHWSARFFEQGIPVVSCNVSLEDFIEKVCATEEKTEYGTYYYSRAHIASAQAEEMERGQVYFLSPDRRASTSGEVYESISDIVREIGGEDVEEGDEDLRFLVLHEKFQDITEKIRAGSLELDRPTLEKLLKTFGNSEEEWPRAFAAELLYWQLIAKDHEAEGARIARGLNLSKEWTRIKGYGEKLERWAAEFSKLLPESDKLELKDLMPYIRGTTAFLPFIEKHDIPVAIAFDGKIVKGYPGEKPLRVYFTGEGEITDQNITTGGMLYEGVRLAESMSKKNPLWEVYLSGRKGTHAAQRRAFRSIGALYGNEELFRRGLVMGKGGDRLDQNRRVTADTTFEDERNDEDDFFRRFTESMVVGRFLGYVFLSGPDRARRVGHKMGVILDSADRIAKTWNDETKDRYKLEPFRATTSAEEGHGSFSHMDWYVTSLGVVNGLLTIIRNNDFMDNLNEKRKQLGKKPFEPRKGFSLIIQGFGDVGSGVVAAFNRSRVAKLYRKYVTYRGINNVNCAVYSKNGLPKDKLMTLRRVVKSAEDPDGVNLFDYISLDSVDKAWLSPSALEIIIKRWPIAKRENLRLKGVDDDLKYIKDRMSEPDFSYARPDIKEREFRIIGMLSDEDIIPSNVIGMDVNELLKEETDVIIPAAVANVFSSEEQIRRLKCALIVEGANNSVARGLEAALKKAGIGYFRGEAENGAGIKTSKEEGLHAALDGIKYILANSAHFRTHIQDQIVKQARVLNHIILLKLQDSDYKKDASSVIYELAGRLEAERDRLLLANDPEVIREADGNVRRSVDPETGAPRLSKRVALLEAASERAFTNVIYKNYLLNAYRKRFKVPGKKFDLIDDVILNKDLVNDRSIFSNAQDIRLAAVMAAGRLNNLGNSARSADAKEKLLDILLNKNEGYAVRDGAAESLGYIYGYVKDVPGITDDPVVSGLFKIAIADSKVVDRNISDFARWSLEKMGFRVEELEAQYAAGMQEAAPSRASTSGGNKIYDSELLDILTYMLLWAVYALKDKDHDGVTSRVYTTDEKIKALARIFIHIRTLGITPVFETLGKDATDQIVSEWETKWLPQVEALGDKVNDPRVAEDLIDSFKDGNILSLSAMDPKKIRCLTFVVRVDFNDIHFDESDAVIDDIRLNAARETIDFIRSNGGRIVLITHSGRPSGEGIDERYRIEHVAKAVEKLVGVSVKMLHGKELLPGKYFIVTPEVEDGVRNMRNGEIALLDNIRFDYRERSDRPMARDGLAIDLRRLGDIFVLDGFPISHRPDASVIEMEKTLPTIAGFWQERELKAHNEFLAYMKDSGRGPMAAIFGGSKKDKLALIKKFTEQMRRGDMVLIGGKLADFIKQDEAIFLDSLNKRGIRATLAHDNIDGKDIGPVTLQTFKASLDSVESVYWNGPMGVFEEHPYERGSHALAVRIKDLIDGGRIKRAFVSGGETAFVVKSALGLTEESRKKIPQLFISTGGGTSTDYFAFERNIGMDHLWGVSRWYAKPSRASTSGETRRMTYEELTSELVGLLFRNSNSELHIKVEEREEAKEIIVKSFKEVQRLFDEHRYAYCKYDVISDEPVKDSGEGPAVINAAIKVVHLEPSSRKSASGEGAADSIMRCGAVEGYRKYLDILLMEELIQEAQNVSGLVKRTGTDNSMRHHRGLALGNIERLVKKYHREGQTLSIPDTASLTGSLETLWHVLNFESSQVVSSRKSASGDDARDKQEPKLTENSRMRDIMKRTGDILADPEIYSDEKIGRAGKLSRLEIIFLDQVVAKYEEAGRSMCSKEDILRIIAKYERADAGRTREMYKNHPPQSKGAAKGVGNITTNSVGLVEGGPFIKWVKQDGPASPDEELPLRLLMLYLKFPSQKSIFSRELLNKIKEFPGEPDESDPKELSKYSDDILKFLKELDDEFLKEVSDNVITGYPFYVYGRGPRKNKKLCFGVHDIKKHISAPAIGSAAEGAGEATGVSGVLGGEASRASAPRTSSSGSIDEREQGRLTSGVLYEIAKAAEDARIVGSKIPTHPKPANIEDLRYTLVVDNNLFTDGEYARDIDEGYLLNGMHVVAGDRFNIVRVDTSNVANILVKVDNPEKTIVQISGAVAEYDARELKGKAPGIRIIRVDTSNFRYDERQARDPEKRQKARFDLYAMMLAARQITEKDIKERNEVFRTLEFFFRTHYEKGDITAAEYINAIVDGNIKIKDLIKFINACLSYRPIKDYDKPDYNIVAATLISA